MSDSPKIPIVREPSSMLETGPAGPNFATAASARHPIDELQRSGRGGGSPQDSPYQDVEFLRSVYGSALAMEIAAERQMAVREKQMGLDHTAAVFQDAVDGTDCCVDVSDFLGLPDDRPDLSTTVLHPYMARFLK